MTTPALPSLYDLTLPELTAWVEAQGAPAYRARQIFHALYQRDVASLEAMTDLPKGFRDAMAQQFVAATVASVERQQSEDGTTKWLSSLADGQFIETVLIPAERRKTVCVSTQVGCAYACAFCASGQAGFRRNLSAGEIVQQVLLVQRGLTTRAPRGGEERGDFAARAGTVSDLGEDERARERRANSHAGGIEPDPRPHPQAGDPEPRVSNVVFMGMGEPLANYDQLLKAIRILNHPDGLKIGARKITISTVGLVPMIERLAKEGLQIELSISLHAPNDLLRSKLMPVNTKYPLAQLIAACRAYAEATKRLLTFEYILIDHVNDGETEARELAQLLKGLLCKINLIPCHPTPGTTWARPPLQRMVKFEHLLRRAGVLCTLRRSRGLDIDGACGQLRLRRLEAPAPRIDGQPSDSV